MPGLIGVLGGLAGGGLRASQSNRLGRRQQQGDLLSILGSIPGIPEGGLDVLQGDTGQEAFGSDLIEDINPAIRQERIRRAMDRADKFRQTLKTQVTEARTAGDLEGEIEAVKKLREFEGKDPLSAVEAIEAREQKKAAEAREKKIERLFNDAFKTKNVTSREPIAIRLEQEFGRPDLAAVVRGADPEATGAGKGLAGTTAGKLAQQQFTADAFREVADTLEADPELQKEFGITFGVNLTRLQMQQFGGGPVNIPGTDITLRDAVNPKVTQIVSKMSNAVDVLLRKRTGAVINKDELEKYVSEMIGDIGTDAGTLIVRLRTIAGELDKERQMFVDTLQVVPGQPLTGTDLRAAVQDLLSASGEEVVDGGTGEVFFNENSGRWEER